jgi:hypothetical protein
MGNMSLCRVSSWEVIAKSGNSRQEAQEAQQKVMFPHHLRLLRLLAASVATASRISDLVGRLPVVLFRCARDGFGRLRSAILHSAFRIRSGVALRWLWVALSCHWMLDVGCWMLDVGCWMLDVGCSRFEVRSSASTISIPNTTPLPRLPRAVLGAPWAYPGAINPHKIPFLIRQPYPS